MLKRIYVILATLLAAAVALHAGTVSGKISGSGAGTVVWIDNPSAKPEALYPPRIRGAGGKHRGFSEQ